MIVIKNHRTTEQDIVSNGVKYDIRARKPSNSRMAVHQWPSDRKKCIRLFDEIIKAVERTIQEGKTPSTFSIGRIDGVKISRCNWIDDHGGKKFFAEVVI